MTSSNADAVAPREILLFAICAGLVAALGELAILAIRHFVFHENLRLSAHVLWMAPLNDALVFTLIGAALVLLNVAMQRDITQRLAALALATPLGLAPIWLLPVDSRIVRLATAIVVIAIAYVGIERALRVAGARLACLFVCAFAATYAVALAIPRFYAIALLVLSAGLAARIASAAARAPNVFLGARRTLIALSAVFGIAGVGVGASHIVSERRAIASLPAAVAGARNVIVIIWDTVRSSSTSLYGYSRQTTPNLDRLAAKSVTFDWAFSTAPWTLTSHASMFTGQLPYDLSADIRTPLDAQFPTLAERLTTAGYATAGFVANTYYCDTENGLARGFGHYEDFVVSPAELFIATTFGRALSANARVRKMVGFYDIIARRSADDISSSFLQWIDHRPDRPFFAFLNYYDAHTPYLPPEPWRSKFGPRDESELWRLDHAHIRTAELLGRSRMTREQRQALLDAYDGGIAYMDDRLGLLLDSLSKRGLLANTVVIVASDHGEHHGEHPGMYGHNRSLHTQEIRVPLVISAPGEPAAGTRVSTPVSLRNLGATVLDLAHVGGAPFAGQSLARFWREAAPTTPAPMDTVLSQYAQLALSAVASGRYHLIRTSKGTQLFDMIADPSELSDLAPTPEGAAIVTSLTTAHGAALAAKPRHPADNAAAP